MAMYWPIILIVVSNIFYHICSKSTPQNINPFAALTVTYLVGAAVSYAAFCILRGGETFFSQCRSLNWTSFVLGAAIVGLEAGSIYMYKVGWGLGTGQLVHSSILAICLIAIGYLFYHESITPTKLAGVGVCLVGLFLINK